MPKEQNEEKEQLAKDIAGCRQELSDIAFCLFYYLETKLETEERGWWAVVKNAVNWLLAKGVIVAFICGGIWAVIQIFGWGRCLIQP